jgi:esterase/lipase
MTDFTYCRHLDNAALLRWAKRAVDMRRIVVVATAVVLALAVVFLVGPRAPRDTTVTFDASAIGPDPEAWLAAREAEAPGVIEELRKEIVWADPARKARTPLAFVYIHGFSASKGEVRPLPDLVAAAFDANLFYTRLKGHGSEPAQMATTSAQSWMNDFAEAMAIGRMIGDEVVIIATSTGGGLTTIGASRPELMERVKAIVFLSPNFGPQAFGSSMLTWPWGRQISDLVTGGERGFDPPNEMVARLWTERYPTAATLTMAVVTELAVATRVENILIPAIFFISDGDRTVKPEKTREIAGRWGGPSEVFVVTTAEDPGQHVIAGDALSPGGTGPAVKRIVEWLSALPD